MKDVLGVVSMITHDRQKAKNIVLHDFKWVQQNTFSSFCWASAFFCSGV